jgi:hypothetical protein
MLEMTVILYDNLSSLPKELGPHIFVFTGYASNKAGETTGIITEVICTYPVGDQVVNFKRNADDSSQRFEDALGWAVKRAPVFGVENVFAVFELNRPIDSRFLNKICPEGIVDRRRQLPTPCEAVPSKPKSIALGRNSSDAQVIRRRLVFRNRNSAIKPDRPFVRTH